MADAHVCTVSSVYTVAALTAALDTLRARWLRICAEAGPNAWWCDRALATLATAEREDPTSLARWAVDACRDYKTLRLAAIDAGVGAATMDVVGDALDALCDGYYNGAAACDEHDDAS